MYDNFEKLPAEKREPILRVAMEEFVAHGYHKASTDTITQRAGISKGILFHYFRSKKGLLLYLVRHARDLLEEKVLGEMETLEEEDFFARIRRFVTIKLQVALDYPLETEFATRMMLHPPAEAAEELAALNARYLAKYQASDLQAYLYDQRLLAKLPLRVAPESVVKASVFIFEQLGAEYVRNYGSRSAREILAGFIQELDFYSDIVKHGVIARPDE